MAVGEREREKVVANGEAKTKALGKKRKNAGKKA